jgi:hypothetical protein
MLTKRPTNTRWHLRRTAPAALLAAFLAHPLVAEKGPAGHALHFDGISDEVISLANFDVEQITVEAWLYVESVTQGANFAGLAAWGRQWHAAWEVMLVGVQSGGVLTHVYPYMAFNWGTDYVVSMHSPGAAIPLQEWTHLAVTYDGGVGRVYVNGVLSDEQTLKQPILPATGASWLSIGNNFPGGPEHFGGKVDEMRIWNIARSQSDIQLTVNRLLAGAAPGLLAYYRFDEGKGKDVTDSSGHGRHAQLGSEVDPDAGDPEWILSSAPIVSLADINGDGTVNVLDLLDLLDAWGPCPKGELCLADLDGDGAVDVRDLLQLLDAWGD